MSVKMMKVLQVLLIVTVLRKISAGQVKGIEFNCQYMSISEVRIQDCTNQPCNIVKGKHHPVQIDFEFEQPDPAQTVSFSAYLPEWGMPSDQIDSSYQLANEDDCKKLHLSSCPARANSSLTLKSSIFIDPNSSSKNYSDITAGQWSSSWSVDVCCESDICCNVSSTLCNFDVNLNIIKNR